MSSAYSPSGYQEVYTHSLFRIRERRYKTITMSPDIFFAFKFNGMIQQEDQGKSFAMLLDLEGLPPEGVEVVKISHDPMTGLYALLVYSPSFPLLPEGAWASELPVQIRSKKFYLMGDDPLKTSSFPGLAFSPSYTPVPLRGFVGDISILGSCENFPTVFCQVVSPKPKKKLPRCGYAHHAEDCECYGDGGGR